MLLLGGITQPGLAADETVDEVLVYGTRTATDQRALLQTSYVIPRDQLQRELPRTVPESLMKIPGVLVQKTASGHGSPYIRGFTGNRTLLVIDGVRYNNATYRDGANEYFSHIDSLSLSQIELLSGPASTLYGSEAVGGTIALRSAKTRFAEQARDRWYSSSQLLARYSSGDASSITRVSTEFGKGESWGLQLGGSFKSFGDIRAAELGTLTETGYDETALDLRLDAVLTEAWDLSILHQDFKQDRVPRTHSTVFSVPFSGTTIGTDLRRDKDQQRELSYIKLMGKIDLPIADTVEMTLARQPRTERETRVRSDRREIRQSFDSDLLSLSAVVNKSFNGGYVTYGFDLSNESIDSVGREFDPLTDVDRVLNQGQVGDDARYRTVGLFASGGWELTERVEIQMGWRGSDISSRIGRFTDPVSGNAVSADRSWSDLSASLRIAYDFDRSRIWAGVSEAFRAPNIADQSRFGRSRSNELEVASFGLEPESFLTSEIGYRFTGNFFTVTAAVYQTDLRNYIDTAPTGRMVDGLIEVSKQNVASGYVEGIELSVEADLKYGFHLDGNLTWLEGQLNRVASNGVSFADPISRIQPFTANLGLSWEHADIWLKAELQLVGSASELSISDVLDTQRIPPGGTPGYDLFNLRAVWQINDSTRFSVAGINLLDEAYRSHGSGTNEAGRHALIGLDFQF